MAQNINKYIYIVFVCLYFILFFFNLKHMSNSSRFDSWNGNMNSNGNTIIRIKIKGKLILLEWYEIRNKKRKNMVKFTSCH